MRHACHADGCEKPVPEAMFMCLRHWRMVPRPVQKQIWEEYVPGQEISKDPSSSYLAVAFEAIRIVAEKENATTE